MTDDVRSPYVDPALYDVVYSWYAPDVAFYVATAKAAGGPVLEVGCGTGRVMLPTLEAGVDIDGLDVEPAMIERLRAKAAAKGFAPRLAVGDMREFTMPRRYALVTVPFRAFMHVLASDEQVAALRCIREHLEPGGALVLNLFFPSMAIIQEKDGRRVREREFEHPEGGRTVAFWDTSRYDRVAQTVAVEREVVESDSAGRTVATHHYGFTLRWTWRDEMALLLRAAGFTRAALSRGFDGGAFERDTDEMVWTAWRD